MDKITSDLEKTLNKLSMGEETENFVKNKCNGCINYFYQYLNQYVVQNHLDMSKVINRSRINKNYVYNITNGTKKNPGRDKIIALCIGAEMSCKEINQGLEVGGFSRIKPFDERDVRIAVAINNGIYDILQINIILEEHNLRPLDL